MFVCVIELVYVMYVLLCFVFDPYSKWVDVLVQLKIIYILYVVIYIICAYTHNS